MHTLTHPHPTGTQQGTYTNLFHSQCRTSQIQILFIYHAALAIMVSGFYFCLKMTGFVFYSVNDVRVRGFYLTTNRCFDCPYPGLDVF